MDGHGDGLRMVAATRGVVIGVIVIKGAHPLSHQANRRGADQDDRKAEDYGKHRRPPSSKTMRRVNAVVQVQIRAW